MGASAKDGEGAGRARAAFATLSWGPARMMFFIKV